MPAGVDWLAEPPNPVLCWREEAQVLGQLRHITATARSARLAAGLSARAVARAAALTAPAVLDFEHGRRWPSFVTVAAVCEVVGYRVVLVRSGEPPVSTSEAAAQPPGGSPRELARSRWPEIRGELARLRAPIVLRGSVSATSYDRFFAQEVPNPSFAFVASLAHHRGAELTVVRTLERGSAAAGEMPAGASSS